MNAQTIKNYVEIIASIGVLLGIVLLAYEVNQNNQLLTAQTQATYTTTRFDAVRELSRNGEMMKLRLKASQGEPLTKDEEWRLSFDATASFGQWQWEWQRYRDGYLPSMNIKGWTYVMKIWPHWMKAWQESKARWDADFVAFMDENVVPQ